MTTFSSSSSRPLAISASTEAQVYGLFALAIALTLVGVFTGINFAAALLNSGVLILLLVVSLAIVFTSRWWIEKSPLNIFLFALFPFISGLAITPYLLNILASYVNAGSILLNALAATVCMSIGAAVFASTTRRDLSVFSRALFMGVIGLIFFGLLQIFIPGFRTGTMELILSGGGIVIFAIFTAMDLQRIQRLGRLGANPFLLALSLYLDIYNLFLYVLRFMLAISGNRRS